MILKLLFVTYIRTFFGHCHVTFPYKEILSFVGHCLVTFPYLEPLSFFGRFCTKRNSILFFFQIHFSSGNDAIFRWQPLCYNQSLAFMQKFQKIVSSFLQLHTKSTLFVKTTASLITMKKRVFFRL